MNEIELPPERDMPDQVRDRVWSRVEAGMTAPGRSSSRTKVLAAAAATVLALGVTTTVVAVRSAPDLAPAAAPEAAAAASDLTRCHDAAADADPSVAAATRWRAVLHTDDPTARVTGYVVDDHAVICEITATTTTVSRATDGAVEGGDAAPRALLATPAGTVAGTVGTDRTGLLVSVVSPSRDAYQGPALLSEGLFLFRSPVAVTGADITTTDLTGTQPPSPLASPPAPLVITSTPAQGLPAGSPDVPAPAATAALASCVAQASRFTASTPPTGARVGAFVESAGDSVVLFLTGNRVDACLSQRDRAQVLTGIGTIDPSVPPARPQVLPIVPTLDDHPLLGGVLPTSATRMEVSSPGLATVDAVIRAGTFMVLLPGAATPVQPTARVFDATGRVLYDGPLTG